jgi:hypothetical protein
MDMGINIGLHFAIVVCSTVVLITVIKTKFTKREE